MFSHAQTLSLLFCLSFVCLHAAPKTERIEFYYGIAEGNYLIGDLRGAEPGIKQMLRINPDYMPALTLKARVRLDQDKPVEALQAAQRAAELEPENNENQLLIALILGHMQRRDEAAVIIEQVIAKAPADSDDARAAQQLLGLLRMAAGEWDQAADAFNNIYHADPESANTGLRLSSEAYLEKARSEMQAGAHDEAIAAIDQAIEVYTNQTGEESLAQRSALRLMRARLLSQIGRYDAAIRDLQALHAQQPENYEALITLASLYASAERWSSLEEVIEPIATRPGLQDVVLYFEGRAALAKNRVGTARAKFEAAIDELPKEANQLRRTLFFYRGVCLDKLGRHQEAETVILNAIDAGFRPETSEEALIASRILLRSGRGQDAVPILEAITLNQIEPSATVWAMLGRAHLDTDIPALALSAFNESLAINPAQAEARALRGSLLRKIGDLEGALVDYQVAYRLSPEDASIAYATGLVYLQIGQVPEAEEIIGRAAAALKDNAGIQLLHALLAYTIGEADIAKKSLKSYQEGIEENPNPTALYLDYLLHLNNEKNKPKLNGDEVSKYFQGEYTRKQGIDQAGSAETPSQARQQICSATFWMAQLERAKGNSNECEASLSISIEMGNPDLTEYQLAKWQLATQFM